MCTVCKTKMMTNKMTIKSFMHRVRKLTSLTCHHPDAKHGAAQYTAQYAAHCTLHMFLTPTNRYHIMGHRVQNNQSNSIAVHYWKRQRVREIREQTSHHVCNLSASSNQASGTKGHRDTDQFSPRLLFKRILTYWQQRSLSGTRLLWSGREQIDPLSSGGLLVVTIRTASDQSRNCYHYCYYYLMISQALARPHFWSMDRSRVGEGAIGPPPWVNRMDSDTSLDSDTLVGWFGSVLFPLYDLGGFGHLGRIGPQVNKRIRPLLLDWYCMVSFLFCLLYHCFHVFLNWA